MRNIKSHHSIRGYLTNYEANLYNQTVNNQPINWGNIVENLICIQWLSIKLEYQYNND